LNQNTTNFAIMFADVADSSKLYETIGDVQAQEHITECFALMSSISKQNGGVVIKTIGDEIMCRFSNAEDAVEAACKIQEGFRGCINNSGIRISVRIGLHYGPAIIEKGDLFGDAVNVASRMVSIAKSKQIITTEQTVTCLSLEKRAATRRFDRVSVKGKEEKITIFEVLWDWEGLTIMGSVDLPRQPSTTFLILTYGDMIKHIAADSPIFIIGRDQKSDIVVSSNMASRTHASIEYRREKFVYIDQSTNGTYIRAQDDKDIYLRREVFPLWGEGIISLGESIEKQPEHLIHFKCP